MNKIIYLSIIILSCNYFVGCMSKLTKSQMEGLIAYYPFNGDANDASGNGNNAVFNNATLTSDIYGNPNSAYYFNGVDNYIRFPNTQGINPAGQISLCVLVKPMGFYNGPCHRQRKGSNY